MDRRQIAWLCAAALTVNALATPSCVYATTTDATATEAANTMTDDSTAAGIVNAQQELENANVELEGYLGELNTKLTEVATQISDLETQISDKETEIAATQEQLDSAKTEESKQYEDMKKRIRCMYEGGSTSLYAAIMTGTSISDILSRSEYVAKILKFNQEMLQKYQNMKQEIADNEATLKTQQASLADMQTQLAAKQDEMEATIASVQEEIKDREDEIAAAEATVGSVSYVEDETAEEAAILNMNPASVDPAMLQRWYSSAVLLGDSIVYAGFAYHWLDEAQVLGENGKALFDSASQFEDAIAAKPSVIFLCFGANDLMCYGSNVDQFIAWYNTRIWQLKQSLPDAVIYVEAILPTRDSSVNAAFVYRDVYNLQLKELCAQLDVCYVDASFILDQIPELYDTDGLHPRSEFYPLWFTYLADVAGLSNE